MIWINFSLWLLDRCESVRCSSRRKCEMVHGSSFVLDPRYKTPSLEEQFIEPWVDVYHVSSWLGYWGVSIHFCQADLNISPNNFEPQEWEVACIAFVKIAQTRRCRIFSSSWWSAAANLPPFLRCRRVPRVGDTAVESFRNGRHTSKPRSLCSLWQVHSRRSDLEKVGKCWYQGKLWIYFVQGKVYRTPNMCLSNPFHRKRPGFALIPCCRQGWLWLPHWLCIASSRSWYGRLGNSAWVKTKQ